HMCRGRCVDRERFALAQAQETCDLVDLGAGEYDGLYRAAAHTRPRMQRLRLAQLLRKIRRCVEQDPIFTVAGDGEACLAARKNPGIAGPGQATHRATTIPLWKTPTCRRTEHKGGEASHPAGLDGRNQSSAGR